MDMPKLISARIHTLLAELSDRATAGEIEILLQEYQLKTEKFINEVKKQCKNKAQDPK